MGAILFSFLLFCLGFWLGGRQTGAVVKDNDTPAMGLMPVTQTPKEDVIPVHLNTATAEEFMTIPGIGQKYAEAIVAFREKHGDFKSVWELDAIDGIGEGLIQKITPYLILS